MGWAVFTVPTGDAVLRYLEKHAFDAVVIDAKITVISAAELCYILRRRSTTSAVPLVVVEFDTPSPRNRWRSLNAGADVYFHAGAPYHETANQIRAVLARRTVSTEPSLQKYTNGRLIADFQNRYVSVDGKPIFLPRLQFEIFKYLVEHRNRAVTRDELSDSIWLGTKLESRAIDVHVCHLRRKLGNIGGQIQTLVSIGYMFLDLPRA